jgi:hypothetical protein
MEQQQQNTNQGGGAGIASPQSSKNGVYQMDVSQYEVPLNLSPSLSKPYIVIHTLRRPTFEEEEARERATPLVTTDAGKIDGADASSISIDDEPANIKLYDKIVLNVKGYPVYERDTDGNIRLGKPSEQGVSPEQLLLSADGTEEQAINLIPPGHKSIAVAGIYNSNYEVDVDQDNFMFALGGGREWVIRQEIGGGRKLQDGSPSDPQFVVRYTFREPTEAERRKFRSQAINSVTLRTKDGIKDRRSTNLRVLRDLFDAMILNVEGATIGGEPVDVRIKDHRDLIPGNVKKGTMIRLFGFLEADLGN